MKGGSMAAMLGLFRASGMSVAEVVRATGRSKATVSQVINGKYHGRDEVVEEIRSLLESRIGPSGGGGAECGREAPGEEGPGDERSCEDAPMITPGQKQAWVLMDLVRKQHDFAVLVGASGVGKTWVVNRYGSSYGADVYTARMGQSLGGLLGDLCRLWNVSADGGNDAKIARLCEAAGGRFLIVDEADLLMGNRTRRNVLRLVEVFRQLYESGCGVVLVGLPVLHKAVSEAGETYVFSRIGYLRQVGSPTDEFLAMYWKSLVEDYPDAMEKAGPVVYQARRGGFFRYLEKLADLVKLFSGDVEEALGLMFRPAGA
jgi:hypothetical protein